MKSDEQLVNDLKWAAPQTKEGAAATLALLHRLEELRDLRPSRLQARLNDLAFRVEKLEKQGETTNENKPA